jgi:hypothetical protein
MAYNKYIWRAASQSKDWGDKKKTWLYHFLNYLVLNVSTPAVSKIILNVIMPYVLLEIAFEVLLCPTSKKALHAL